MSKILCVLDGFGLLPTSKNNATGLAQMPNFKYLLNNYFWTTLNADGVSVGQEAGLVGNSEVGHMNIGGLKLVPQLSYQITGSAESGYLLNKEITPNQLFSPQDFLGKLWSSSPTHIADGDHGVSATTDKSKTIHLVGLFSTGSIHSDLRHWAGSIEAAGKAGGEKIVLHIISDGRDSDRQSLGATWEYFINKFESQLQPYQHKLFLGSVGGRFYSMDRDNNWGRVARGIMPMFEYKAFDKEDEGNFTLFKKHILAKYEVNLDQILESEKQSLEKDNRHFETEEEYQEFGYKNFHVFTEQHFYTFNPDKAERLANGPLKTDIKWMLEFYSKKNYNKEIYDEFILPCSWYYLPVSFKTRPFSGISKNDTVWLLNFRTDRMKQFASMLCDLNQEFKLNLTILSNNSYGIKQEIFLDENLNKSENIIPKDFNIETYKEGGYYPIFKNKPVKSTLAEYISKQGQTQLHIAETEKFNHVTYFMNGGQSKKWEGEDWVVIDSNKVNSHAEKPEMKAKEVTDYILESGIGKYDYILVNYANPDMIGHTGNIEAAIKTMEVVDEQLGRLIEACESGGHSLIITADHGNVEKVGNFEDNQGHNLIDTEHNSSSVPLIVLSPNWKTKSENIVGLNSQFIEEILAKAASLEKEKIHADSEKLGLVLNQTNLVNLSNNEWLDRNQIPTPVLPLWYAGLLVLIS